MNNTFFRMKVLFECDCCHTFHDLGTMYYCSGCKQFLCSRSSCVCQDVDYYYCPICFKTMLSTDLSNCRYCFSCHACYLCPQCKSQLSARKLKPENTEEEISIVWNCSYCNWNSKQCSISANSVSLLKDITSKTIMSIEQENKQMIKSAAECISYELNLKPQNPSSYYLASLPLKSSTDEKYKMEQKEHIESIRNQICYKSRKSLPIPSKLRTKSTITCQTCKNKDELTLLVKPQIQPILGDSSLTKGNGMWLRVWNLALFTIPLISLHSIDDEYINLCFANPGVETVSNVSGIMHVNIVKIHEFNDYQISPWRCSFMLPNMDTLTYDPIELAQINKNNESVIMTEMTSAVVRLKRIEESHITMVFSISFQTYAKKEETHEIHCTIDF